MPGQKQRRIVSITWIDALGEWPTTDQINGPDDAEQMPGELVSLEDVSDEELVQEIAPSTSGGRIVRIELAVQSALAKLTADERELVERYLLAGQSMPELADLTGRRPHRLQTAYLRACRKLRALLTPFVVAEFSDGKELTATTPDGRTESGPRCPLCLSPRRPEIDQLILARPATETWKGVIGTLRTEYGLRIATPQILIGHLRYHVTPSQPRT